MAVLRIVAVTWSVMRVGLAITNTREDIAETPSTLGWLNFNVYVPGANRLLVMLGHSNPEYVI